MNSSKHQPLLNNIKTWSQDLGFQDFGVSDVDLSAEEPRLRDWLDNKYNGTMKWLENNHEKRIYPAALHEGTIRILSFRMNYLPPDTNQIKTLTSSGKAYVSRYALGRDYHKLIRKRLQQLAKKIEAFALTAYPEIPVSQRPFVDSAPVLERPIAQKAGLGWIGKHTLILNADEGSWFFLGELFTNIPLPISNNHQANQCGDCEACLKVCPTDAFPKPYVLDARRCISYLTIENAGPIPEEFREPMGNRVFGCDDCQAICPWNKNPTTTLEADFSPRHNLDNSDLLELFNWDEDTFLNNTSGSPIRRIGYDSWKRNLAIGLGNAETNSDMINALETEVASTENSLLREHFEWALSRQRQVNHRRKRKIHNPNK